MQNKSLIGLIAGILTTGLILSVATKTPKAVKASKAIKSINKAQEYKISPAKVFDRAKEARDINSAKEQSEKMERYQLEYKREANRTTSK